MPRHLTSSPDLITWSPQELLPVMNHVPDALNAWAPECFFDRQARVYRLIWSSTTSPSGCEEDKYQRCWSCSTTDFKAFTRAEIFFDPGYSIIDACVQPQGESYLMAFKDERGENKFGTPNKAVQVCSFSTVTGEWSKFSELITPALTEGPALFTVGNEWHLIFDHFLEGKMGAMRSLDGWKWENVTHKCEFPPAINHASVLPISQEVAARLTERFGLETRT